MSVKTSRITLRVPADEFEKLQLALKPRQRWLDEEIAEMGFPHLIIPVTDYGKLDYELLIMLYGEG